MIGMVLALIVLLGFGCLSMFAFDPRFQGAEHSIESIIASQEREIGDLRGAIAAGNERLAGIPELRKRDKQLAKVSRENLYREGRIASLMDGVESGKEQVAAKMEEFEAYKDEYRSSVRGRAKGTKIDKLVIKSGKSFNNASIREVTAIGMQIRHDAGHVRVDYEELPDELQDYYQFDPSQKLTAMIAERENRAKHSRAVAIVQRAEAEKLAEIRAQEAEIRQNEKLQRIEGMKTQSKSFEDQINQMERRIRIEKNKRGLNHSPEMVETLNGMRLRLSALQSEIARLRSEVY